MKVEIYTDCAGMLSNGVKILEKLPSTELRTNGEGGMPSLVKKSNKLARETGGVVNDW